jgi:hypothetical protein
MRADVEQQPSLRGQPVELIRAVEGPDLVGHQAIVSAIDGTKYLSLTASSPNVEHLVAVPKEGLFAHVNLRRDR